MRFKLIYEGGLRPRQSDATSSRPDPLADHVQSIRRTIHPQLKELWKTNAFLSTCKTDLDWAKDKNFWSVIGSWEDGPSNTTFLSEAVAEKHSSFGYKFVPLVRTDWKLECELDIVLLRREHFTAVKDGDLDNRVKTLIDGLRMPKFKNELGNTTVPGKDEDPFFVLLEDDTLITNLKVNVDQLLLPKHPEKPRKDVYVLIDVTIRPITPTVLTISFA